MSYVDWPEEWHGEVAHTLRTDLKLTDHEFEELKKISLDYENGVVEGNDMDEYDKTFIDSIVNSTTLSKRVRYAGAVYLVGIWAPYLEPEILWSLTVQNLTLFFDTAD